jgi:phosphoribosylanthranilate isomerase
MADPALKICGITRREDAEAATAAGAGYLGFVLVPSSPRVITAERVASLTAGLAPRTVVVLADEGMETLQLAERAAADVIQLHGRESAKEVKRICDEGRWEVWKAVRVKSPEAAREAALRYGEVASGLVLDGWHPTRLGGAGARFSWESMAGFRSELPPGLRFVVAGGITPLNVGLAVRLLSPDVIDVSSGVERRPGVKDHDLIQALARGMRETTDPITR